MIKKERIKNIIREKSSYTLSNEDTCFGMICPLSEEILEQIAAALVAEIAIDTNEIERREEINEKDCNTDAL